MIKSKILKILPFWLIFIIISGSIEASAALLNQNSAKTLNQTQKYLAEPMVLGASTSIRGQAPNEELLVTTLTEPDFSDISAKSFLAFNLENGQTIFERNSNTRLGIASLTKLMTALVAYRQTDLHETYTVRQQARSSVAPVLGLFVKDEVKALDLFNAMLIGSCNDAGLALSDFTALKTGKEFVDLMNLQAKELKMEDTNFSNPLGFDSAENYSSANDLKILISNVEKLAAFTNLGRRTEYNFLGSANKTYHTKATNKLIYNHPDIQAIKTGYTNNSGGAMATKISVDGNEIILIVLGSQDREGDTLKLKKIISQNYSFK